MLLLNVDKFLEMIVYVQIFCYFYYLIFLYIIFSLKFYTTINILPSVYPCGIGFYLYTLPATIVCIMDFVGLQKLASFASSLTAFQLKHYFFAFISSCCCWFIVYLERERVFCLVRLHTESILLFLQYSIRKLNQQRRFY